MTEERRDPERRANVRLRRVAVGLLACWAVVSTIGVISLVISAGNDHRALRKSSTALENSSAALASSQRAVAAISGEERRGCHKLNVFRAESNRNQLADWRFDTLFIGLIDAGLKHQTNSVKRTSSQTQETMAFIQSLRRAADAKAWVPLATCPESINEASPRAILFQQQLPPRSALVLGPHN